MPEKLDSQLVFYCMGQLWIYSSKAARLAVNQGYTDVYVYRKGLLGWIRAGNPVSTLADYPEISIPLIDSKDLARLPTSNAVLVDIRPPAHYKRGHIGKSLNIDLEDLQNQLGLLSAEQTIVLIDHKGKLTLTTGRFLSANGFRDIRRIDGGFNAWVKSGLPVVKSDEIISSKE